MRSRCNYAGYARYCHLQKTGLPAICGLADQYFRLWEDSNFTVAKNGNDVL